VHTLAGHHEGPGVRAFTYLPVEEVGKARDLRRPVPVRVTHGCRGRNGHDPTPSHSSDETSTASVRWHPVRVQYPLTNGR
jgi:hypothetical protein